MKNANGKIYKDASMAKIQAYILEAHPDLDVVFEKTDKGFELKGVSFQYNIPVIEAPALSYYPMKQWKLEIDAVIQAANTAMTPAEPAGEKTKAKKEKAPHVEMTRTAVSFPDTAEARAAVLAFCADLRNQARN